MPDDPEYTVLSTPGHEEVGPLTAASLGAGDAQVPSPGKVPAPGVTIGGFKIIRPLGKGGMGEVYLAHQTSMDRNVALKILPSSLMSDREAVERFLHEVRMAAKLEHPRIVTAYEAGQDAGLYFLAMAYVKGRTIAQLLRKGTLDEKQALAVTREVCEALAYAWREHRMLHRDIKPTNIMLDQHESARLMDMGLSKMLSVESGLTMTNVVVGTPNYMSPEQARGSKDVDTRSDMYSLGATLYHMVTGRLPFKASSAVQTLRKQLVEELPHPRELVPELSDGCADLIRIMMAKDRNQRHETWEYLLEDIKRVELGKLPTRAVPPAGASPIMSSIHSQGSLVGLSRMLRLPRRPRSRVWLGAAAAVALAAAAGGLWYAREHSKDGATTRTVTQPPQPARTVPNQLLPAYRALVIGVSDYAAHNGGGWAALKTARADAEAAGRVLEEKYGFNVKRLLDGRATRAAIMSELDKLVTLGPNDAVVIYFAGHGYYDGDLGEGYWIPRNARKRVGDRLAKEDWLWNSSITKVLSASTARHILVIADSCYAGALLRGKTTAKRELDMNWYRQAILRPSRFVIASGDLEPVLDSGARHSVFGQEVLNYLEHSGRSVFSASDLGLAAKRKVAALTGQMVQMAPLVTAGHAGGEFVFVEPAATEEFASELPPVTLETGDRDAAPPPLAGTAPSPQHRLRDILALAQSGATNAAGRLVASMLKSHGDTRMVRSVADYLDSERRSKARDRLSRLIDHLAERKAKLEAEAPGDVDASLPRPRVVACIGPETSGHADEGMGLLYRICLRTALEDAGGLVVVEREAIEEALREMDMGSSSLADARAKLAIGKLLPAGMLLAGNLMAIGEKDQLYLRLIDTETTRVLGSFRSSRAPEEDLEQTCAALAAEIVSKAVALKPIVAPLTDIKAGRARAAVGMFHGIREGTQFDILQGEAGTDDEAIGTARAASLSETSADLALTFTDGGPRAGATDFWIRERQP